MVRIVTVCAAYHPEHAQPGFAMGAGANARHARHCTNEGRVSLA